MTKGPTPTQPPKNEAEYARKLALAILSTLESKGVLSRLDVDTILHAAHRAAQQPITQPPITQQPIAQPPITQQPAIQQPAAPMPAAPAPALPETANPAAAPGERPGSGPIGPAILGTRWVRPGTSALSPDLAAPEPALPAPAEATASDLPTPNGIKLLPPQPAPADITPADAIPASPKPASTTPASATPTNAEAQASKPAMPVVIDFTLD